MERLAGEEVNPGRISAALVLDLRMLRSGHSGVCIGLGCCNLPGRIGLGRLASDSSLTKLFTKTT
eukprot:6960182-Pyramimonas_sp.AAC.1